MDRVVAAVAAYPGATSHDVAATTGITLSSVSGRLSGLLHLGRVVRTPERPFRYTLAPQDTRP